MKITIGNLTKTILPSGEVIDLDKRVMLSEMHITLSEKQAEGLAQWLNSLGYGSDFLRFCATARERTGQQSDGATPTRAGEQSQSAERTALRRGKRGDA